MRAVVAAIRPMAPLALELQAARHEMVWDRAKEACPAIERLGFRSLAAGLDGNVRKVKFAPRAPRIGEMPARRRRPVAFRLMFGEIAAPAMCDELAAAFDEFRPQLVLHQLPERAAAPMAIARGLPHVTVGFSGALSDELVRLVPASVSPLWAREHVEQTLRGFHGELLLHPFPTSMHTPRADGPCLPMGTLPFGGAGSETPPDGVERFGAERAGICMTFGTEMALAWPWHAVLQAVAEMQVDVVATVGRALDVAELEPLSGESARCPGDRLGRRTPGRRRRAASLRQAASRRSCAMPLPREARAAIETLVPPAL